VRLKDFLENYEDASPQTQEAIDWIFDNIDLAKKITEKTKIMSEEEMERNMQRARTRNDITLLGLLILKQYLDINCPGS